MFDSVQHKIFIDMYKNTFLNFVKSKQWEKLQIKRKDMYNNVQVEDYDFFEKLGSGGFASVIRVRKKTTGQFYAMKVQRKMDLVETFCDDPRRLNSEKAVFAACHHPFIVNLDYSIQTPTCAILILGLANAGNLQDVINSYENKQVEVKRYGGRR